MEGPQEVKKCGVQGEIESTKHSRGINFYIVPIVWKDGKESEFHFPVNGFSIVDPKTNEKYGDISGMMALEVLKRFSQDFRSNEFSWIKLIKEGKLIMKEPDDMQKGKHLILNPEIQKN
jgi:hypothetical protein